MEKNSDLVKIYENNMRVKTLDCKIINTMLQDLIRYKTIQKVQDENFIFMRRALNEKQESKKITDD